MSSLTAPVLADIDCISFILLQRAIESAARSRGLTSDCLAEIGNRQGTFGEELLVLAIVLDLPPWIRRSAKDLAHRMARSLVLTARDGHDSMLASSASLIESEVTADPPAIVRATREAAAERCRRRRRK